MISKKFADIYRLFDLIVFEFRRQLSNRVVVMSFTKALWQKRKWQCIQGVYRQFRVEQIVNSKMKFYFYGQIATALGCYGGSLPDGFEEPVDSITPGLVCGANSNTKIVGGRAADESTWPWLVLLEVPEQE